MGHPKSRAVLDEGLPEGSLHIELSFYVFPRQELPAFVVSAQIEQKNNLLSPIHSILPTLTRVVSITESPSVNVYFVLDSRRFRHSLFDSETRIVALLRRNRIFEL